MPVENITENMNDEGHKGLWYSVIDGMDCYRVRVNGDNSADVHDQENNLLDWAEDADVIQRVIDELRGYLV